jgi:5S rRNA maturation endonuclease (ribonuclease M5)
MVALMKMSHLELDYGQCQYVSSLASERVEEILENLGVDYTKNGNKLSGPCPVHGGDNHSAWHVFIDGRTAKGNWYCYTHNCHDKSNFGTSIVGLVRGIISYRENRKISFYQAIQYLCDFLKIDIKKIKINSALLEKMQFVNSNQGKLTTEQRKRVTRVEVRKNLIIPSEYYINRGYSARILNKFDVGKYDNPNEKMKDRVIVPIYDERHFYIGCMGRTLYNKCSMCCLYHSEKGCPVTYEEKRNAVKWVNSSGLARNQCLYNYWNAKDCIKKSGVAVIVEGPGDVWRLEEAGIHNSVAMFGVTMGDEQREILEKSGAFTLIVLTDNDNAGKMSKEVLKKKCGKLFTLVFPQIDNKDVGETPIGVVKDDLKPYIESFHI